MRVESQLLLSGAVGVRVGPAIAFAAVALLLAVVIALYLPTARSMVAIWGSSGTFSHGYLVLPAALWFVWQHRGELAAQPPAPFWPGLVAVGAAGALWLLGELSSSAAPAHFALFGLAVAAALTLFGQNWFRVLAFPLGFLIFAVPFGEAFVPVLIDWTADFTVAALQAVGVPVLREGNELTIPTGRWSVVEACSGVRYLLASAMAGVLYAWTIYRSPLRRGLFIVASVAVPIVANWLRAFIIVMLGHLSNNQLAAGVDHLIYGWVFFGMVIFALFWVGARWREEPAPLPAAGARPAGWQGARGLAGLLLPALAATFALLAAPPLMVRWLVPTDGQEQVALPPVAAVSGWRPVDEAASRWRPQLHQPRALAVQSFERDGVRVTLVAGLFRHQHPGSELVNVLHRLTGDTNDDFLQIGSGSASVAVAGRGEPVLRRARLRSGREEVMLLQWYWLGGRWTARDAVAKLDLALNRLLGRDDTSAWLAVVTPYDPARSELAGQTLANFVADMGPSIDSAMQATVR